MINNIVIFENERVEDLYPFSIMHCSWELRTGMLLNFERIKLFLNNIPIYYIGREKHQNSFFKRFNIQNGILSENNILLIDGAFSMTKEVFEQIKKTISESESDVCFMYSDKIVARFIKNPNTNYCKYDDIFEYLRSVDNSADLIELKLGNFAEYLWDTLDSVAELIVEDIKIKKHFSYYYQPGYHGVLAVEPNNIYIGQNVKISQTVYLDASEGPIVIGDNVTIMSQASIIGPVYIGENSIIKIGAKIYGKNLIGPWCKVGGELENTIIHGYSNKQHEGFLGHSYICEWVNLGADTNNSDLKNTYSNIKMRLPHKTVDTGRIFLGLMCGDHTKTAINTQFNTGTIAGISSILFESGFLSTTIPSFCWGGGKNSKKYKLEESLETAKIVMARRNKQLTDEEITLLNIEYNK